ncbi:MAG: cysteine hydrolase family protein [Candidatus Hermodarchaeota archaeon]
MWDNTALIVIDVQLGLFTRETPIYNADDLIKNINTLINRAHSTKVPVFFIQHSSPRLKQGSNEWQFHPKLQVSDNDTFIMKTKPNSFFGTNLKDELDAREITKVVIVGIWTHNCVQATCKGAKRLGYEVILVKDGHSRDGEEIVAMNSIESWNEELSKGIVELMMTHEIRF